MMNGKGIMIWKGANYGTLSEIVKACLEMGLRWVALKIGDAASPAYASFSDMPAAVRAFRDAGISVWGWHYIYGGYWYDRTTASWKTNGVSPAQEAAYAVQQVSRLGLDGYMIDAEKEYKVNSPASRAASFMAGIRGIGKPVALCSYRFPSYHPEFPFAAFLAGCDYHMPQVYHSKDRAVMDLERSWNELQKIKPLPFVPVGRAYVGDGYGLPGVRPDEITGLMQWAWMKVCPGVSFWAMDFLKLHAGGAARAEAIMDFPWGKPEPEPVPVGVELPKVIGVVRVTAPLLNVRSGPGVTFRDIGDLITGAEMYVMRTITLPEGYEWAEIGSEAWVRVGSGLAEWVERY
jgi:hypothetical protein